MIGVFVTFNYADRFDEQAVRKIAETARAKFEGMPGLRSKAFTLDSGKREAANFYVWDSEDAAKAFLHRTVARAGDRSLRRAPERRVCPDCRAGGEHPA
ncbi:MAG TPA: YdhR family protein [Burkholderiaceae bacterium]|nr:YdhR family protein [Burkholderiaceae bacterium]